MNQHINEASKSFRGSEKNNIGTGEIAARIGFIREQLSADKKENRINGLNFFVSFLVCEHKDTFIDPYYCELTELLSYIIFQSTATNEINLALTASILLSLNGLDKYEQCAVLISTGLLPILQETTNNNVFRFFSLACYACFSIHSQELCIEILNKMIWIYNSPRSQLSPSSVAEIIKSITLLLSSYPSDAVGEYITQIEAILDKALNSPFTQILSSALSLIPVVYDALLENEMKSKISIEDVPSDIIISRGFSNKYKERLKNVHTQVTKKADQKSIHNEASKSIAFLDGNPNRLKLNLNNQEIFFDSPRKITIVETVKRLTKKYFLQHMSMNLGLQQILGYSVFEQNVALAVKRVIKSEIKKDHIMTKKEKDLEIKKRRNQKERQDNFD